LARTRKNSGQEGNAEINEDALRDLAHANIDDHAFQANQRRQNGQKEPGVDAVEEHLKNAVEGHQASGVIRVSLRQLVPHNHHGDAAGQADQNQPGSVLRIAAQK